MAEHYALPGQLVVGTDSHTPHSGALGCVAFGVGTTDMANAFVTGAVRLTVPQSLRVELDGRAARRASRPRTSCCTCWRCPTIRAGARRRQGVRVRGRGRSRAVDRRARDAHQHDGRARRLHRHRRARRGNRALPARAPRRRRSCSSRGCAATTAPRYAETHPRRLRALPPMVARARRSRQRRAAGRRCASASRIDIAYGGSCTAGKREDFDHYHAVLRVGRRRAACACRRASSSTCSSARPPCATTAWRAATSRPSRRSARGSCSPRAAPAPTAGRAPRCAGTGHGERDQPQLSRPLRAGPGLAREPADRGGERDRGRAGVVRGTAAPACMKMTNPGTTLDGRGCGRGSESAR